MKKNILKPIYLLIISFLFYLSFTNAQTIFDNKEVIFAENFKIKNGTIYNDIVRLGKLTLNAGGSGIMSYELYSAQNNNYPTRGVGIPNKIVNTSTCNPSPIWTPTNLNNYSVPISWRVENNTLIYFAGNVKHIWEIEDSMKGILYRLSTPTDKNTGLRQIGTTQYVDAKGYAYLNEISNLTPTYNSLPSYVEGKFYQNNSTSTANLIYGAENLRKGLMSKSSTSETYSYSYACSVNNNYMCQINMSFNEERDNKAIFFHYGHDYNKNGCLDETNHAKKAMPIYDIAGQIKAMVYIEYSYELDRYPIVSIR